jgi:tetratricopeptide (TPR) repeat protein
MSSLSSSQQFKHGVTLATRGDYKTAAEIFGTLLKKQPNNHTLLLALAGALASMGLHPQAQRHLQRAARIKPNDPATLCQLGCAYRDDGNMRRAADVFDKVLGIDPGHLRTRLAKAGLLHMQGDYEAAYALLDPGEDEVREPEHALSLARTCGRVGRHDDGIAVLTRFIDDLNIYPVIREDMLFQLGTLLDEQGEYDRAFDAFRRGNELKAASFDPEAHHQYIDRMIAAWSPQAVAGMLGSTVTSKLPVFIVGMPRSGTSLVEQILASHSVVHGAGELNDLNVMAHQIQGGDLANVAPLAASKMNQRQADRRAREYIARLKALSPTARRVVDKMPDNALRVGLISRVLPGARIIHCLRDPMDTCLSCYFQNFTGNVPYCFGLEHLGAYYKDYRRLMDHWRTLPGIDMLDVVYEELVDDLDGQTRRLLDFVGLDFEESCLRFHENKRVTLTRSNEQVRRPIYRSSIRRHEHYARHIEPLRLALGEYASAEDGH